MMYEKADDSSHAHLLRVVVHDMVQMFQLLVAELAQYLNTIYK